MPLAISPVGMIFIIFENYRISSNEISLNRDQICRSKILIKNAGSEPPVSGA
jgi:hypothetical protein